MGEILLYEADAVNFSEAFRRFISTRASHFTQAMIFWLERCCDYSGASAFADGRHRAGAHHWPIARGEGHLRTSALPTARTAGLCCFPRILREPPNTSQTLD